MTTTEMRFAPSGTTRWVSLQQACSILGVNQSTVRRWADSGLVRAFRTPGGHRRLAEEDLIAITESSPARLQSAAITHIRRELVEQRLTGWQGGVASANADALRPLGRRLVELVGDSIARRRPQVIIEHEIDEIGRQYGALLLESRMPLPSAIGAFTFFRRSLDETARLLAERRELDVEEAARARGQIAMLADRVLICVAAAYAGSVPAVRAGL
jgi:excisionase family DNA binding protein